MQEIVLVKYGGSIVTDKSKPLSVNYEIIQRLNDQISQLANSTDTLFIIGNGGGAFGHYFASKYSLYGSSINNNNVFGICAGKNGNNYLNQIIVDDLLKRNVCACSSRISNEYLQNEPNKKWAEVLLCLSLGIVPVIYGDVLLIDSAKYRIVSTEQAFLDLCDFISCSTGFVIKKVIFCTDTDGVLDSKGATIPIWNDTINHICLCNDSSRYDVTGGMNEKIQKATSIAKYCDVYIVNGKRSNSVISAYNDEKCGTKINKIFL